MTVDLLKLIFEQEISVEDAERIYDEVVDGSKGASLREVLGLSRQEWTAFGFGVWFDELAVWRYEGWPRRCQRCGLEIDVGNFGWQAIAVDGERHRLRHFKCPGTEIS